MTAKRRRANDKPANHGLHWYDAELTLIYRVRPTKANGLLLAKLLQRTESAIDWVWRHMDENREIGPRGSKELTEQIHRLIQQLGPEIKAKWGEP